MTLFVELIISQQKNIVDIETVLRASHLQHCNLRIEITVEFEWLSSCLVFHVICLYLHKQLSSENSEMFRRQFRVIPRNLLIFEIYRNTLILIRFFLYIIGREHPQILIFLEQCINDFEDLLTNNLTFSIDINNDISILTVSFYCSLSAQILKLSFIDLNELCF